MSRSQNDIENHPIAGMCLFLLHVICFLCYLSRKSYPLTDQYLRASGKCQSHSTCGSDVVPVSREVYRQRTLFHSHMQEYAWHQPYFRGLIRWTRAPGLYFAFRIRYFRDDIAPFRIAFGMSHCGSVAGAKMILRELHF